MNTWRALALGVGIGLTPGCAIEVEGFVKRGAAVSCRRTRECNRSYFDSVYDGDLGKCKEDRRDALREVADNAAEAGCEYIPKEGRRCLRSGRKNKSSCGFDADEEITEACAQVFDCGENSRIEITL